MDMPKGYRSYRGRPRRRSVFPLLAVILILIAAILFLYFGLQDYIVFSSDGLRFLNPFEKEKAQKSPSPSPVDEPDLIIATPEVSTSPTPEPAPTPEQSLILKAVFIPDISDSVSVAGAIQLAEKGVINTVVIDMKHDDGTLAYTSSDSHAIKSGANPESDVSLQVISQLKEAGLHLVARMSAFKDNLVPRKIQSASVKVKSGVIWLDRDYHGWLNPYIEEARDYVVNIANELADLGFDEILLDNFCYPTLGRPHLLYYGEFENVPKTDTLNSFAADLSSQLAEKDVALSILVDPNAILNGPNTASGQDPETLYNTVDRLFTNIGTDPETSAAIHAAIESYTQPLNSESKFVPVIISPRPYDDPSASENIQVAIGTFLKPDNGWLIQDPAGLYPPSGW